MSLSPLSTTPAPVYDCHVLLRKPTEPGGRWIARCAAAPEVAADGPTERETLIALVTRFKFFLHEHCAQSQPIPWRSPPLSPQDGEVERFIPVHL